MSVTERRYFEGLGQRFLGDGVTIRCHGVSKTRLRERREELGNPDLTSDDVWPELQCSRGAMPGAYACKFHGGASLGVKRAETINDILPIPLRNALELVLNNPDYMNRKQEMDQLVARNVQLFETMQGHEGGLTSWEIVDDACELLERGEVVKGLATLKVAKDNMLREYGAWDEVRENMALLDRLTRTQVSTAKTMQQMMTTEQAMVMVEKVFQINIDAVERFIEDESIARKFINYISGELRKFNDLRALGTIEAVAGDSSDEVHSAF